MKKYRFRLDTVLRVRRLQEEQARYALLEANRSVIRAAEELRQRRETLVERTALPAATEPEKFIAQRGHADRLAAAVRTAAGREVDALEVQTDKRDEWSLRAQRVASLERLDERASDQYRIEANRDEMKLVDDLVSSRFGREVTDA